MPKRPRKLPRDPAARAVLIARLATGEVEEQESGKDPKAVAAGQKGGRKGGQARAKSLSAARRREIAKKAARARWARADSA